MRIAFFTVLLMLLSGNIIAQKDSLSLNHDIEKLNAQISTIKASIEDIEDENMKVIKENELLLKNYRRLKAEFTDYKLRAENRNDSLRRTINTNSSTIEKTAIELDVKIEKSETSTSQKFKDIGEIINNSTLFWIVAVSVVFLLIVIVFFLLKKQIFKEKNDLISNIRNVQKNLEEESVKLDNKFVEVLDNQLKLVDFKNRQSEGIKDGQDHTLVLKVADEIVRIEKNISKVDKTVKGIKPLVKGIERIKDNFKANGYDMIQLLGLEYDDGMKIEVINFIDDDNIEPGKKIITRIIKPQVNFDGKLIQRAQVDVSQA